MTCRKHRLIIITIRVSVRINLHSYISSIYRALLKQIDRNVSEYTMKIELKQINRTVGIKKEIQLGKMANV